MSDNGNTHRLYFLGLYEPNSAGMLRPLFVEDRGNFLTLRTWFASFSPNYIGSEIL